MLRKSQVVQIQLVALALTLTACAPGGGSSIASNLPSSSGSDRLTWSNQSITMDRTNSVYSSGTDGDNSAQAVTVPLSLSLVGTLSPPVVGGASVYASDITFSGTKVYVAYNTPGSGYGGGVDVVQTLVPALPVLTSSTSDASSDFSRLLVSGSNLFAAGGDVNGGSIRKYPLDLLGNFSATPFTSQTVNGAVGVGLAADTNNVYVIAGNGGGISTIAQADLSVANYLALDGARDIRLQSGKLLALTGKTSGANPLVNTYTTAGIFQSASGAMPNAVIDEAKATLLTGSTLNIATAGQGGVNVICAANGTVMNTIPNPVISGLTADLTAANGVAYQNGLLYVANGGAGIYVYALEQANPLVANCNVFVNYVGKINFADGVSVNNVAIQGTTLVAATGAGGFKIVTVTTSIVLGLLNTL